MLSSPSEKTVLCVDDEEAILALLQIVLERDGYSWLGARTGRQALDLMAERPVHAVVLDHSASGMNVEELIRQTRKLRAETPIVLFTGLPEIPSRMRAMVNACVAKGEELTTLRTELRRLLRPEHSRYSSLRKFPRYPAQLPFAALIKQAGKTAVIRGLSIDIGEGGMGGRMGGEIACDQRVVICLSDSRLRPLSLQAQVRYRYRDTHGFEFLNISASDKARVQQLCRKLASA